MDQLENEWIGFCQYRKFWTIKNYEDSKIKISDLPSIVLQRSRRF